MQTQSDKIVNGMVSVTTVSISALSVLLVVFLLIQAFILNNAYVYGQELQKRCGVQYLEKETGHYQIHKVFIEKVQNNFDKIFLIFAILFIILIGLIIILFLFILLNLEVHQWADDKLLLALGTLTTCLFLVGSLHFTAKETIKTRNNYLYLLLLLIPIILNFSLGKWFIDTYWYGQWLFVFIILLPLLVLFGFLLFVWGSTIVNKANNYFNFISPFSKPSLPIKNVMISQYVHLGAMLVTTLYFYMYFTKLLFITDGPMYKLLKLSIILSLIFIVLLPVISYGMYTIKTNNAAYAERIKNINDSLRKLIGIDQDPVMLNNLLRNIINAESPNNPNVDPNDILSDKNTSLADYIKHTENYIDLTSISLHPDLTRFINPSYLIGEELISLKQALVDFYHPKKTSPYILTSNNRLQTNYHINRTQPTTYDKELASLAYYLNPLKYDNLYTLRDILMETNVTQVSKINIKKEFLGALNTHVINSTEFANTNPLPRELYTQLREIRDDNSLEKDTSGFFKTAKGIIFSGLILGSYVIFHKIYNQNPILAGQAISAALIVTIIIVSYVAFLTKDTWL